MKLIKKERKNMNMNEETDREFWNRQMHEMSEEELKTIISRIEKSRENMMTWDHGNGHKSPINTGDFNKLDRRLELYKAKLGFRPLQR
jgi:hypothetical protein